MLRIAYFSLVCVVGFISAYDVYLSIKLQDTLLEMEQNPLGRLLIELDGGDVALFMTSKMVGTAIVLFALAALHRFRRRWAWPTVVSVSAFQSWLFCYLTFV